MVPDEWQELYKTTLKQVKNGTITLERLDDAVRRILRVKMQIGLLDGKKPHEFKSNYIGDQNHFAIARRAVRESLVLLKNNNNVLPLNPSKHYLVVGDAALSINSQMGGWTITWQARDNKNSDYKNVQNIYSALAGHINNQGGSIEFSKDGSYKKKPDSVIFIFGEEPYAEGDGDRKDLEFISKDANYIRLMQQFNAANFPIISIFLSGRPMEINRELNLSDSFIAAWLPGSAVEGISDVIFTNNGSIDYDFTGKLPYSWPKTAVQNVNFKDAKIDDAYSIDDKEALPILYDLIQNEGLSLGTSCGINIAGAIRMGKELGPGKTIVTILCDRSDKYATKMFNKKFLEEKGLPIPIWF